VFKIKNLAAAAALRKVEPIRHRNQRVRRPVGGNIASVMAAGAGPVLEADTFLQLAGYTRHGLEGGEIHWPATAAPGTAAGQKGWERLLPEGADTPFEKEYCRKGRSPASILPGFSQSGASLPARDRPACFRRQEIGLVMDLGERQKLAQSSQRFERQPRSGQPVLARIARGHGFFRCGDGS
jgi:hypothetical protein